MHPFAAHVPLTRIRAVCESVELRVPTEAELAAYVDVLAAGGLDDDHTRSTLMWRPDTPELAAQQTVAHVTEAMTRGPGPRWLLPLFVFVDGVPIGRQDLQSTDHDPNLAIVSSASVLVPAHRRRGIGTRARACALEIAWALGARRALTAWLRDNAASARVSEKLGYERNGLDWWWDEGAGVEIEVQRAVVTEAAFRTAWTGSVLVTGVDDDVRRWLR